MRTLREIYETYRIMPQLQLHQLRVASVAKMICESLQDPINAQDVILTCLFHDMGNIVKSDFDDFPDSFLGPKPRAYWEGVKREYIEKYAISAHEANLAISAELGLSVRLRNLMDGISFSNLEVMSESSDYEQKICEYADLRVGPYGTLLLDGRIEDIRKRYSGKSGSETPESDGRFNELKEAAHRIERQIFEKTSIRPEDITDESVAPIIEELWEYPIA